MRRPAWVALAAALLGCGAQVPAPLDGGPADRGGEGARDDGRRGELRPAADQGGESPAGPWVRILKPGDGETVRNPVVFTVAAGGVATVRLFADGWPLGAAWDPAARTQHSYTFNGLGYQRLVELLGYDAGGAQVAADRIRITVQNPASQDKGQRVGTMWVTYYYLAREADHSGAADTTLYDASCAAIAKVPAAFADAVCVEGSGQLADGRVINYARSCSCGRPCPTGGTVCYAVLDKARYPWGMGAASNALAPLRSVAVDKGVVAVGTVLYAEQWDGVAIPAVDGLGGFTHDGCLRADDVGGAIQGLHYDFFAGTRAMWLALEKLHKTRSDFTVYQQGGRCAYLLP